MSSDWAEPVTEISTVGLRSFQALFCITSSAESTTCCSLGPVSSAAVTLILAHFAGGRVDSLKRSEPS